MRAVKGSLVTLLQNSKALQLLPEHRQSGEQNVHLFDPKDLGVFRLGNGPVTDLEKATK